MEKSFEEYRDIVEEHLLDFIPSFDDKSISLYESMKYSLTAGGKRIRPVLLLAACDFAGGDIYEAIPYAVALEYIHTYSLIHDDLPAMDDDVLRRGKPTNHRVYGDAIAILAGDGLLNTAFEAIYKDMFLYFDQPEKLTPRIKAAYTIAKGAGCQGMIAGQISDIESEGQSISTEMLEYIHINKTGALIKSAIKAGLFLGNADSELIESMDKYAEYLGLAYQISDDILDVTSSTEVLGKTVGIDTADNKSTFVSVLGLEESKRKLNETFEAAKDSIAHYYDNAEFFSLLIDKLKDRKK